MRVAALNKFLPMNIGIVGLGLIGGSLGLDLLSLNQENPANSNNNFVWGISRNPDTCQQAEAIAAVNIARTNIQEIPDRLLQQTEIVVICTPIAAILPTITNLAPQLPKGLIFTDVGSVKAAIVEPATAICAASGQTFIGSHPMAGTAFQGILAAEKQLFRDRPCVITFSDDVAALAKVRSLWQLVGMQIYECSAADHDRAVAMISHLPVMISAALIHSCQSEENPQVLQLAQNLASSGFRDTSRVGGGNPELGRFMAEYNQLALLKALQNYQQSLQEIIALVENSQWQELESLLTNTQSDRANFV